jgi:hypothetical protein
MLGFIRAVSPLHTHGKDGAGLQPLPVFCDPFPGALPQAGMDRAFGAHSFELRSFPFLPAEEPRGVCAVH